MTWISFLFYSILFILLRLQLLRHRRFLFVCFCFCLLFTVFSWGRKLRRTCGTLSVFCFTLVCCFCPLNSFSPTCQREFLLFVQRLGGRRRTQEVPCRNQACSAKQWPSSEPSHHRRAESLHRKHHPVTFSHGTARHTKRWALPTQTCCCPNRKLNRSALLVNTRGQQSNIIPLAPNNGDVLSLNCFFLRGFAFLTLCRRLLYLPWRRLYWTTCIIVPFNTLTYCTHSSFCCYFESTLNNVFFQPFTPRLWCQLQVCMRPYCERLEGTFPRCSNPATHTHTNVCVWSVTSVMVPFTQLLCAFSHFLNHYSPPYENSCCH